MNPNSINAKTALVTGANRGIGFEVCRQLGKLGFHVFLSARNKDKGEKAVNDLHEDGIESDFILMDVADEFSIKKAASDFENFSASLDVIINNAAVLGDEGDIAKLPASEL